MKYLKFVREINEVNITYTFQVKSIMVDVDSIVKGMRAKLFQLRPAPIFFTDVQHGVKYSHTK
jgi:predicted O-linked N-acetylglucosamine transferase (SPINDLY family)